jgi:hypothetical protein
MAKTQPELDYYRAVEDHFAGLRGVPHVLSPKDFQLLRTWWREEVALAAVLTGITEVFARRAERGDDDPVVSLSYCRHAVRRQAKRLQEMRVGAQKGGEQGLQEVTPSAMAGLADQLEQAAAGISPDLDQVRQQVERVVQRLRATPQLPAAAADEYLFALETALLESCWTALPEAERERLDRHARDTAGRSGASGEALQRSVRAVRDAELRRLLGVPRLELP